MSIATGTIERTRDRLGRPKMTDELVAVCRLAHFRYGVSQTQLARRWGVSITAMSDAINGKTYKHVPMQ